MMMSQPQTKEAQLEAQVQYQENYRRRNNLRIKSFPEIFEKGNNVMECVMDVVPSLLPQDHNTDQIVIKRAHIIPATLKEDRQSTPARPRHILVKFLRFADREKM